MMRPLPLFSIVIPTYNRADILPKAIDSLLIQSYKNFEVIVVDDGSTDHTKEVAERYGNAIQYLTQSNQGVSAARNYGVTCASGKYLIFLDSDDRLTEDALEIFNKAIDESDADVIFCQMKLVFGDGHFEIVNPRDPYKTGTATNLGVQLSGAFCVRTEVFREAKGYDTNLRYAENTELFWRINLLSVSKHLVDKVSVVVFREEERTSTAPANVINSMRYILEKHRLFLNTQTNVKWLYLNNLGVMLAKSNKRWEAIICFVQAIRVKPLRWRPYARIVLSIFKYY